MGNRFWNDQKNKGQQNWTGYQGKRSQFPPRENKNLMTNKFTSK